jgi:Ser-tRNA(Ala) deacylase AlaX
MTALLFRDDAYRSECTARVLEVTEGGLICDQTIFYPQGGGRTVRESPW